MTDETEVSTDERYTPPRVLTMVRKFAPIGLDPCTVMSNPTTAYRIYTLDDSGLSHYWAVAKGQCVFVNPPYSRGALGKWCDKICFEAELDPELDIIALLPSDLGTKGGEKIAKHADALCFVRGRLKFTTPGIGDASAGAKQPSIIAYFGERSKRFHRVFSELGTVWRRT